MQVVCNLKFSVIFTSIRQKEEGKGEEEKDEDKKKEEGERGRGGKEGETFLHLNSTAKLYNVELIFNFVVRVL